MSSWSLLVYKVVNYMDLICCLFSEAPKIHIFKIHLLKHFCFHGSCWFIRPLGFSLISVRPSPLAKGISVASMDQDYQHVSSALWLCHGENGKCRDDAHSHNTKQQRESWGSIHPMSTSQSEKEGEKERCCSNPVELPSARLSSLADGHSRQYLLLYPRICIKMI